MRRATRRALLYTDGYRTLDTLPLPLVLAFLVLLDFADQGHEDWKGCLARWTGPLILVLFIGAPFTIPGEEALNRSGLGFALILLFLFVIHVV